MKVVDLRCEFEKNPLGIGEVKPRLSWRMEDGRKGARQSAWQVRAHFVRPDGSSGALAWDSGRVEGWESLDHEYAGRPLKSRSRVAWQVRIWDDKGEASGWSETATFELGLLKARDWRGTWIARPARFSEADGQPSPYLRREFTLPAQPVSARLHVSALGLFEMRLNGAKVGRDVFAPGWTYFDKRVQALTYDVAAQLRKGRNVIGGFLGAGQYAGLMPYNTVIPHRQLALLAQLEVVFADGSRQMIATDESWRTSFGPILSSEFWHGELYDARLEMPGWDSPGFVDAGWEPAVRVSPPTKISVDPARSLPVRRQIELAAVAQTEPAPGTFIFDMGQNMVGWARIKVRAPRGTRITVRFGEMLNPDGSLYRGNLTHAKCTDAYICKGGGEEIFEPTFTYRGFRFAELTGLAERPDLGDVTGVVVFSEMEERSAFRCSNPLVNKLHENIRWGMRGNFLDVPTDCPQRGERLGWTGDAQIFARTAMTLYGSAGFFTKWNQDILDSQSPKGAFPDNAPNIFLVAGGWSESEKEYPGGNSGWGDAGVICPWMQYLCHGDRRLLERHYASMAKWIAWQEAKSDKLILNSSLYGDWLALDVCSFKPAYEKSLTPRNLISTAYFARTTALMRDIAAALGKADDARRYGALSRRIKAAFAKEFVTPSGRVASETQSAYALALGFGLVPEKRVAAAGAHLVRRIHDYGDHLSTGFLGTPLLCPVLTRLGYGDLAYKLLLNRDFPGWLYPVTMGATTVWENWNGYTKELGYGFGSKGTGSFNHYAFGAVAEWLYASVLGIDVDPADPAYHNVVLRPCLPPVSAAGKPAAEGLAWAEGHVDTRYGRVACRWERRDDGRARYSVSLPANTSATLLLPGRRARRLKSGEYSFVV